jgi:hypothetical protein
MNCKSAILIILLFAGIRSFGQADSTFGEVEKAMQQEFDAFAQENQQEFDQYVEEIDKEFSDYLRKSWEEFHIYSGIKPDTTPKPKALPKYNPAIPKIKPGGVPTEIILLQKPGGMPSPVILPVPNLPVVIKSEPAEPVAEPEGKALNFYGTELSVTYDPGLEGTLPAEIHNTTIADFWDRINKTNYAGLIKFFNDTRTKMNLNDWGYYMLVNKSTGLISSSKNYSRLLCWFLLTKSGYRVRVAYAENQIALMFPSSNTIYGLRYFNIDQVKFYAPDFAPNQIYTYEKDFPGASKVFDLNLYNALNIGDDFAERTFNLSFKNRECSFSMKYNMNSIAFFKDFPLCELNVYFDAVLSPQAKESILDALKPQLNGLTAADAVDFLLNFVQNGFPYKTDQDQFNGAEKFFFPEEDFYYPYSDCDDRAVFFAYLVRELLGFKVVGVVYPGHIATAVRFPSDEAGDFIIYKNEKYLIADPTYINAPFGLTMPGMVNAKAEIIELANEQNREEKLISIWDKAATGGGLKGDNRQNSCTDSTGNLYLSGYFHKTAYFGGTTLTSSNGKNDAFLAKYNAAGNPVWAIAAGSDGNCMGYNVRLDPKGNIYVCGIFEKNISFGRIMTMAEEGIHTFVAKFNSDGRLVWLNKVKQDTAGVTGDYIFSSSFTSAGKLITTKQYPADVNFTDWGLSFDGEENVYYTGSYNTTAGMKIDRIKLSSTTDFNIITTLKDEIDKQVANNCEQTIAGLFGALSLMKYNSVNISGKMIQEAFEKYNPRFKEVAPKVYERLGQLKLIKNEEGIVTITTEEGKSVIIDKLKILNDTRLRVTPLPTGDTRIDILNGVKVGKAFIWFTLNYVRLFRVNGNVLFDYDSDHSQINLNMKKDILM